MRDFSSGFLEVGPEGASRASYRERSIPEIGVLDSRRVCSLMRRGVSFEGGGGGNRGCDSSREVCGVVSASMRDCAWVRWAGVGSESISGRGEELVVMR